MRRSSLMLLLILLAGTPLIACAQVYQWTDAHGTVHYADTPPPQGVHYKDVKIVGSTVLSTRQAPAKPAPSADQPDATASAKPAAPVRDTPDNRKQLCTNLKANLALLNKDGPVVIKGSNGKNQVLSKKRRAQELKKMRKQQQTYCQN